MRYATSFIIVGELFSVDTCIDRNCVVYVCAALAGWLSKYTLLNTYYVQKRIE